MNEPLLSVIVPVYKVENLLRRCVDSILEQTYRNLEVILVDDGSPDGSGAICDEYMEKDSRVLALHKENGGQSSARNMALDRAKGEYIAFVDSDDWIEPDAYRQMMERALKYDVKLVWGGRFDVSERTGKRAVGLCPRKEEVISCVEAMGRMFIWDQADSAPWDKLYHRSLFEGLRFPMNVIYEDVALVYQLVEKAGKVCMLDLPFYNYWHRQNSTTTAPLSQRKFLYEAHTREIYDHISRQYPQIEPQVRYLRIHSLVHSVMTVDLAGKEERRPFLPRARQSRRELRHHMGFLLRSPFFGKQERLTDILLALGLYRPFRKLYHGVK